MKLLKQFLPLFLTLAFTAAAVFWPPMLSQIRDTVDFSGPKLEEATPTEAEAKPELADSLALIAKAQQGNTDILESYQYFSGSPSEDLLKSASRELEYLCKLALFPEGLFFYLTEYLFSEGDFSWSYSLVTCADAASPFHSASYWSLQYSSNNFSLQIHMEVDSEKIFTIDISDYNGQFLIPFGYDDSTSEGVFSSDDSPLMFFPFSAVEFFHQFSSYLGLPLSFSGFDNSLSAYSAIVENSEYGFFLLENTSRDFPILALILQLP